MEEPDQETEQEPERGIDRHGLSQKNEVGIMKKDRFTLESDIMNAWNTSTDIDMAYRYIGDNEFFQGMNSKHADKIANILSGLNELHELRMNQLWDTFETLIQQQALEV